MLCRRVALPQGRINKASFVYGKDNIRQFDGTYCARCLPEGEQAKSGECRLVRRMLDNSRTKQRLEKMTASRPYHRTHQRQHRIRRVNPHQIELHLPFPVSAVQFVISTCVLLTS